nr:hypothetical protein [Deltaproteobacteria bacterium]
MSLDSFHHIDLIVDDGDDPPQQGTPLVLATGAGEGVKVNFHGKVDKYLCHCASDSLAALVVALAQHVEEA